MFETIKRLFKKENGRFLTTSNSGIELADNVLDAYGWLDIVYDKRTGILYCGTHKPYSTGFNKLNKIKLDDLFRGKEDLSWDGYTIYFAENNFLMSTDILEAMGIKKLKENIMEDK